METTNIVLYDYSYKKIRNHGMYLNKIQLENFKWNTMQLLSITMPICPTIVCQGENHRMGVK